VFKGTGFFIPEANGVGAVNQLISGIGAVLGLWLFDLITTVGSIVLGKQAMGGGDAKLAAMLGAWLAGNICWVPCRRICGWSCDRIREHFSTGWPILGPFLCYSVWSGDFVHLLAVSADTK